MAGTPVEDGVGASVPITSWGTGAVDSELDGELVWGGGAAEASISSKPLGASADGLLEGAGVDESPWSEVGTEGITRRLLVG